MKVTDGLILTSKCNEKYFYILNSLTNLFHKNKNQEYKTRLIWKFIPHCRNLS